MLNDDASKIFFYTDSIISLLPSQPCSTTTTHLIHTYIYIILCACGPIVFLRGCVNFQNHTNLRSLLLYQRPTLLDLTLLFYETKNKKALGLFSLFFIILMILEEKKGADIFLRKNCYLLLLLHIKKKKKKTILKWQSSSKKTNIVFLHIIKKILSL